MDVTTVANTAALEAPVRPVVSGGASASQASAPQTSVQQPSAQHQAQAAHQPVTAHTAAEKETGSGSSAQVRHNETPDKTDKESERDAKESLEKSIDQINKSLVNFNRRMEINLHDKLNRIMVKVVDTENNKVIREIPPEKALDAFAKALELAGVLVDVKR